MPEQILIVEDDPSLQETLEYKLTREGYQVQTAGDGQTAVELARRLEPDLIVLDIMLPIFDGFEVCRILRQDMNVPIIMQTARDEEINRIIGLEMGADDYVIKPFSMQEFLSRVKAQLRRVRLIREEVESKSKKASEELEFNGLVIDTSRREVRLDGEPLSLNPKVYELLLFLAHHRGQALSRDLIMEKVWGWEFAGGSRTVDVHIHWLRNQIERDPVNPTRIVTVRGAGYRFDG
ncbi:MAG: response regulator transcription factor [Anaerolineales bacterium]